MHWAETTEILGRAEKIKKVNPKFILRGEVQQVHEYGKFVRLNPFIGSKLYRIRVLAVPPSKKMSKFQTGFFMHWADITEILGGGENFQTGTPIFFLRGGTASTRIR